MTKVLVVDDEAYLREDLRRTAERAGADVTEADDRDTALALIDKDDFDLVITDLIMGRYDEEQGLDVLRAAKKKDPLTQVIVVTQHPTAERGVNAMLQGAFDYIERNVPGVDDLKLLASKVGLALKYRQAKQKEGFGD